MRSCDTSRGASAAWAARCRRSTCGKRWSQKARRSWKIRGTAPGLWIEDAGHLIALLPGPPRELKPLFREQVLPRLERRVSGVRLHHREIRVTGLGESHVEQRILPIYSRYPDVNTTILAAPGEMQIHLRAVDRRRRSTPRKRWTKSCKVSRSR